MEGSINREKFFSSSEYRDGIRKGLKKFELICSGDLKRLNFVELVEEHNLLALTRNVKECALLVLGVISGTSNQTFFNHGIHSQNSVKFLDKLDRDRVIESLNKVQISQLRTLIDRLIFFPECNLKGESNVYTFKDLLSELKKLKSLKELDSQLSIF